MGTWIKGLIYLEEQKIKDEIDSINKKKNWLEQHLEKGYSK